MQLLCVLLSLLTVCASLKCKDCVTNPSGQTSCANDCFGDACIIWKFSAESIQGCLTGAAANAPTGCRRNSIGAILCVCNDSEQCNEQSVLDGPVEDLPKHQCSSYSDQELKEGDVCEGNFCYFSTELRDQGKRTERKLLSAGCAGYELSEYDFDVQLNVGIRVEQLPPIMWPGSVNNSCYLLQTETDLKWGSCMCDSDFCNKEQPFPLPKGDVVCDLTYVVHKRGAFWGNTGDRSCRGQYCVIFKTEYSSMYASEWEYRRGCITVVSREGVVTLGYSNVLGFEQWICDKDWCNQDIETAMNNTMGRGGAMNSCCASVFVTFCLLSIAILIDY